MMASVCADLLEIAGAVEVIGPRAFVVGGQTTTAADEEENIERTLTNAIYKSHYCRPSGAEPERDAVSLEKSRELIGKYSEVNRGRGMWESGWKLRSFDEKRERYVVEKHGLNFCAAASEIYENRDRLVIGESVRVRIPKELRELFPGFYVFLGNTSPTPVEEASGISRFYWHLSEPGAVPFVRTVSGALNRAKIPFRAKVLRNPSAFLRADAAVLYLPRRLVRRSRDELQSIYRRLQQYLRPSTPMFTLPLAPGLGAADDPGEKDSFGQHRCLLTARGLLTAFVDRPPNRSERLASILRTFAVHRVSPELPHLRTVTSRPYPRFGERSFFQR